jgi:DNA adenine methylase
MIVPLIPDYEEYREPMVGGGSVFLALRQLRPKAQYWINDLHEDVFAFWVSVRDDADAMMRMVFELKARYKCEELFQYVRDWEPKSTLELAVRYYILNRISFGGMVERGTLSRFSYKEWTASVIRRLAQASSLLEGVRITNEDYAVLLREPGDDVFIFLDPPYSNARGHLYGKRGLLHKNFSHERFAHECKMCSHRWLVTYGDDEMVRKLFAGYEMVRWRLRYTLNNMCGWYGDEIFIANYPISHLVPKQLALELDEKMGSNNVT